MEEGDNIEPLHTKGLEAANGSEDQGSSSYGSDFGSDEEALLNELLAKVSTSTSSPLPNPTTTTTSKINTTIAATTVRTDAGEGEQAQVEYSLGIPFRVTDIEDNEPFSEVPLSKRPKVFGKDAFASSAGWKKGRIQSEYQSWGGTALVEHHKSTEGRERKLEKQLQREPGWTADGTAVTRPDLAGPSRDASAAQTVKSPLERFRKPPNKSFSVSDLVSPAWCELQYWYILTKHGRKRRTPAMKQGSSIHRVLEEEVHTTVAVEVTTKEDSWALRIWNIIQGLRTLREFGLTRELEVWGVVDGEIVNGVIDQLSYECPDVELEASAAVFYANVAAARATQPECQMSITDYLLSAPRKGIKLSEWGRQSEDETARADRIGCGGSDRRLVYITDIKTRASRSIPTIASSSFHPTKLQLELYFHMLNRMTTSDDITIDMLARRYGFDPEKSFTDKFITEVGGLNDTFFDALSTQMSNESSNHGASQDSMTILLAHNDLSSLWRLMKEQLTLTFLPHDSSPVDINAQEKLGHEESQPQSSHSVLRSYNTIISPVLTATYLSSQLSSLPPSSGPVGSGGGSADQENAEESDLDYYSSATVLGSRSFLFDPITLSAYLSDQMSWWRGNRAPRGVDLGDAVWKCRICEFREECEWRRDKEKEYLARKRKNLDATRAFKGRMDLS